MQVKGLLYQRQSCPGGAYYVCQNGFKGCCSVNPCDPGGTCPDNTPPASSSTTMSSNTRASTSVQQTQTTRTTPSSTFSSSSSSTSTTASSSRTSSSSVAPTVTGLSCPGANGTTYTDAQKVRYSIRCNADNSYSSFDSTPVGPGGFTQCFSACDRSQSCAGFTFVGLDSGQCYLKSMLPAEDYSNTAGSNYVTCAVVERNAEVSTPSTDSSKAKSIPIAAIAGGVVGGVLALLLLALLLFFCLKRRRKNARDRHTATLKSQESPREGNKDEPLFASLGGFYRGKHADTTSSKSTTADAVELDNGVQYQPLPMDKKIGHVNSQPIQGPRELEGNPIYPAGTVGPPPVEMDATPIAPNITRTSPIVDESPVLGRLNSSAFANRRRSALANELRRKNHILSWNNYDASGSVSPPSSYAMSPRIGSPDVSPVLSDRGTGKK